MRDLARAGVQPVGDDVDLFAEETVSRGTGPHSDPKGSDQQANKGVRDHADPGLDMGE
jgi:hypothetical protein